MNRLVIIGNGFDVAHGLPTGYKDFIDNFWKNFKDKHNTEEYKKFVFLDESHERFYKEYGLINDFNDFKNCIDEYSKDYPSYFFDKENLSFKTNHGSAKSVFEFKNELFKIINKRNSQNWVDIENEYYTQLKKIAKDKLNGFPSPLEIENFEVGKKNRVVKLNNEFEEIRILLESYLNRIIEEKYVWKEIKNEEIISHIIAKPLYSDFTLYKELKEFYEKPANLKLNETLFLSFNYTLTAFDYSNYLANKKLVSHFDYIHGILDKPELPIIFGFGDEMDDDYKIIENIDDNNYLKFFKSIQYLEHSGYKYLYNFIETEPYQVFIMGHSCGLSDRTLLSTVFENDNCLSIKVFYHQKGKEKNNDNYTKVIQNISRHFKDKKMLRKKVVEKRHCKPLILFKEKQNDPPS